MYALVGIAGQSQREPGGGRAIQLLRLANAIEETQQSSLEAGNHNCWS